MRRLACIFLTDYGTNLREDQKFTEKKTIGTNLNIIKGNICLSPMQGTMRFSLLLDKLHARAHGARSFCPAAAPPPLDGQVPTEIVCILI